MCFLYSLNADATYVETISSWNSHDFGTFHVFCWSLLVHLTWHTVLFRMMKLHGGTQRSLRGGVSGMVYVYQWWILDEEMITYNSGIIKLICRYKNSIMPGFLPREIMGCLPGLS